MTDPILHELQLSMAFAIKSQTVQESSHHLRRAFALFSEETTRLKKAYLKLQERFQVVNQELGVKITQTSHSNFYLPHILKHISDALLFLNLEGIVALFNPAAERLLKIGAEQVLYKKFWDTFQGETFGFSMREALKFGIAHQLLYVKEMEISTSFIYDGPKINQGMLLIFKDISEKQALQSLAGHNERMKELGTMTATVAHEIRNPLGSIRGFASLLLRDLKDNAHLQEMASCIIEGTKGLEKMVNAVLHYAKPIAIEIQTLDLASFIKQLSRFIKLDAAFPSNIKLSLHVPDTPLLVPFDPTALRSALLNLLFNAIQAMPQGGELTISLLMMAPSCQIAITDTGVGIDEKQQSLLFSPFYTTKRGGNGLGLVETKKIIEAHLGEMNVRSKPGKGSTFTISLPIRK